MSRQNHRAPFVDLGVDGVVDCLGSGQVDARERLVEQEDVVVLRHPLCDEHALALAP